MKVPRKSLKEHQLDVAQLQKRLLDLKTNEKAKRELDSNPPLTPISNTIFNLNYPHWGHRLGIEKLNSVLLIDPQTKRAIVEPRLPMDQLARAVLEQGLLVPVVPEFKGITVGGAINGAAIESSSHLYGQFNDCCVAYEILLGNGDLIRATPTEHADLFYGIVGSYGSLGLIVSVELELISAQPWVNLNYHCFDNVSKALDAIQKLHQEKKPPDFIEGILFSEDHTVVVEGRLTSVEKPSTFQTLSLKAPWSPWYYQHVEQQSTKGAVGDKIFIEDYLFRHDRGAFWMGAYAAHGDLFLRYLLETQLGLKIFGPINFKKYSKLKNPNLMFRSLLGCQMSSRLLYKLLHSGSESWFKDKFIVQDYFIPSQYAEKFILTALNEIGVFPLWLCPVKATDQPQVFSPHYLNGNSPSSFLFIDVGVYGMPRMEISLASANQLLEEKMNELGGRKMLYSYNYYTQEQFWKIYPQNAYEQLQEKYKAKEMWIPIYEKISGS